VEEQIALQRVVIENKKQLKEHIATVEELTSKYESKEKIFLELGPVTK